ncbi:AMP-binding protein [Sneathiella chungangensis]|uniref:AMP-binding protein n=1 Tax=Sneathiella chungangensis TaxID=1418234 RepID=A0A845MHZ3_9PROT|nr:AMP-binding protein [Sneathiella chungangensis]MZR22887.1 AMP-binding protein [Sneathiella chungangensis]
MFEMPINPGIHPFDFFCARFDAALGENRQKPFADLANGSLTYRDLATDIDRLGTALLEFGLTPGDRVLIVSKDEDATVKYFLTLLRAGITPVIGDAQTTGPELAELIGVCDPAALFADESMITAANLDGVMAAPRIRKIREFLSAALADTDPVPWPDAGQKPDVALLVLTSGTTSTPKAVELTYENLIAQLAIFADVYGFDSEMRLLNLLPLHHVDGLIRGPLSALWFGGSLYRRIPFSVQNVPTILDAIRAEKITHFITVPAMLRIVARLAGDRKDAFQGDHFRFILCSADLLDAQLWSHVEETFGVPVVNAYGLSEVVCDALFAGPADETRRIGSLGRPYGCTAAVLDDNLQPVAEGEFGELVLSGPTIMRGYFNAPEITAGVLRNGAFHTGDYVRVGSDGVYEFVGRKKTAIVSAGATIHPESITIVLSTMPGVAEAVAFGLPDATRGEKLVAALAPQPGQTITAADAFAFCRQHLSAERTPAEFRIMDALPRGASGKVQMAELKALAAKAAPEVDGSGAEAVDDTASLEEKVCAVAASCFNVDASGLSADSTPFNTDGWDSLAHMALIEELEYTFDMQFSAAEIAGIASLGDAMEFIGAALKDQA